MESTLKEFVRSKNNLMNLIKIKNSNPLEMIMNQDFLKADDIRVVDGVLRKVVFLDAKGEDVWAVDEIIALTNDEVNDLDPTHLEVYNAYMEDINVMDFDIEALRNQLREMRER